MDNTFLVQFQEIICRIIVLLSTFLCSYILFCSFKGISTLKKNKHIIIIGLGFVMSVVLAFLGRSSDMYVKLLLIIFTSIIINLYNIRFFFDNIPISILSISIAYYALYFSVVVSSLLCYLLNYTYDNIITTMLSSLLQFFFSWSLLKIKKVKVGIQYLNKNENIGFGLIISSYVLIFSLLLSQQEILGSKIKLIMIIGLPLAVIGLLFWLNRIISLYYKNKLQDRANEYTQKEIEDKDKRIERLEAEVTALAKQVHRDNHLMTSVDRSVQELAACDSAEQREQIIGEIHTLYMERNDSIAKEQQKNKILPSTGFALIDSSLSELYVKAAARGISFDLTVSEEPYYLVNNIISQTDLQTLLCDHIKDAIIAVESAGITDGRILVTIEKKDSIYEIAIRDNGVDFDADTLARIGKEQVTTHADDGGSGIGFMTTFETLHKTKGSLIITEYEQKTPFSKSVAFVFDGLNRFVISSYRKEELENTLRRDDVIIIGQ